MNNSLITYFLFLWISNRVKANDFVYDYYINKSVNRVTLFSCEETENDFGFVKKMNSLGISVAVNHPNSRSYVMSDQIVRKDHSPFGLFLDTRCQTREINEKIIAQSSNYRLYESIHIWLVLGSSYDGVSKMLNDTAYSLLTDLVVGVKTKIGYDLYDIYNPCKIRGGKLNVTRLGTWTKNRGLNITLEQSKFVRRSNLHGLELKVVGVVKYQPRGVSAEDYLQDYTTKSKDPVTKYGFSILLLVADIYNFTMKVLPVGEWIATINGTEVGIMPEMLKGEADVSATTASAILRYVDKPYAQMVAPGYPYRTFFLLRSSEKNVKWTELLTPFAIDSWYAATFTAVLSIIIITTIQMTEYDEGLFAESGHAIFATIGVFCMQGLVFVPNRLSGRVAFLFLLIMGVLLSNYYGASVVAVRLSQPPNKMNDSLYSLAKSQMTVASEAYRNVDDIIQDRSLNEWEVRYFYENVWSKLSSSMRFAAPEMGLEKVITGDYAYHTSAEVAYPYVDAHWDGRAICEMTEVHVVTPRIFSFYERVNSPFTEIMRVGILKTASAGLRRRAIKKWKPKTPYCSPVVQSLQSVAFTEIAAAVIIVVVGATLATIICFVERILHELYSIDEDVEIRQKKARVGGKKTLLRS